MTIADTINDAVQPVDDWINDYPDVYVWYVAFVFIIAAGLFFLWKFKAMQVTTLPEQAKLLKPSNLDGKPDQEKKGMISSFQAFCVGMGARVGVGNITGVTSAIIMGGAGAVFWMWIFALLGACTSFVECTLGQLFKEKKSDGNFHGGPAYYIKNGLKNHKFAIFIAFWIIVTYGVGFIANQAANSASAFTRIDTLADIDGITIVLGVVFAALTAALIFGGIRRVAKVSEIMVPIMVVIWLALGIIAILIGYENIGWAASEIFNSAFDFKSIFGGFAGSCIMWGLKRGVFSNEAGIGSVPNVASQSHVDHPVRQGLVQSIGVLIDTIVVCSITAFMVLTCLPAVSSHSVDGWSGIWANDGRGSGWAIDVVQNSLSDVFGGDWILWVLAIFMFVFAFSSLIAYYSMSEANLRFIKDDNNYVTALRVFIVVIVFIACVIPVGMVWDICDVFMAVMGILNIIALFCLYKYVVALYKDYRKQKAAGVEVPVFNVDNWDSEGLDTSGITVWSGHTHGDE
jgi:AGCS family alanine or glycine:cation symporter/putative sodium/glutamine symporter